MSIIDGKRRKRVNAELKKVSKISARAAGKSMLVVCLHDVVYPAFHLTPLKSSN